MPNFPKSSPNSLQAPKGHNIYNKAQFESPKHLHQTTFETLLNIYNKPCFEAAYLGENVLNLIKQKGALNITISLGYFIFSKNHNAPPKVAQLVKNHQIGSPCLGRRSKLKKSAESS
jgi:hypothetical protein